MTWQFGNVSTCRNMSESVFYLILDPGGDVADRACSKVSNPLPPMTEERLAATGGLVEGAGVLAAAGILTSSSFFGGMSVAS